MMNPHMIDARICRAHGKCTKLTTTAGYFVVLIFKLGLYLFLQELVDTHVCEDMRFDVFRHGFGLPSDECLYFVCFEKLAFHMR